MNVFLIILGFFILIMLATILGWLVRIFDLLAWRFAIDAADAWGVLQDSVQLKMKMEQVVERIAKGHGQSWAKKVWPAKHMDPELRKEYKRRAPVSKNDPQDKVH